MRRLSQQQTVQSREPEMLVPPRLSIFQWPELLQVHLIPTVQHYFQEVLGMPQWIYTKFIRRGLLEMPT